jgi:UDP:flavonoid glycosyltransferase YjiC (YdhE family)
MRITLIASGSRGDVQPYIALGTGLAQAGYDVRLATHENYADLTSAHGLAFWPIAGNVDAVAQSAAMRERLEGGNFLAIMSLMAKEAERAALHLAEGALAACRETDLIMGGMGGLNTGLAIAEKLDLPFMQAHVFPFTPTKAFGSVLLPRPLPDFARPLNRLSHHVARQIMWQGTRAADRRARQEVLGLAKSSFFGPYNSAAARQMPTLYGFSPAVIAKPADWAEDVHVTGYWFLDAEADWQPPAGLNEFLQHGSRPLYIGFGSISSRNPEQTAELVLAALERTGQRAVVLSGWGGLKAAQLPETVFMVASIPHAWLFPRMAAVVHHGGAGTTAAGLRAGVPSLVIPVFGDQPFWGRRVAELGVGPAPIPRKKLTVERLATAIETALADEGMIRRAAELGGQIQAEDGLARAAEIVAASERRVMTRRAG